MRLISRLAGVSILASSIFLTAFVVSGSSFSNGPCCVTDHGLVYQVVQFATLRSVRWDVYYNATNTHYVGDVVVKCDYWKVGMYIEVSRNVQKPLPLAGTPFNPIANGTGFKNVVSGPVECQ